jgi:hypothetical protein
MKRLILALCTVLVALWPLHATAQEPAHAADSPRVAITIDTPTLVGDTMLKPGSYRFQCRHLDGKSFLIVTTADNKEVARVKCEQEALPEKMVSSELRTIVRADGLRSLQSVRIKGEIVAHRVVD